MVLLVHARDARDVPFRLLSGHEICLGKLPGKATWRSWLGGIDRSSFMSEEASSHGRYRGTYLVDFLPLLQHNYRCPSHPSSIRPSTHPPNHSLPPLTLQCHSTKAQPTKLSIRPQFPASTTHQDLCHSESMPCGFHHSHDIRKRGKQKTCQQKHRSKF